MNTESLYDLLSVLQTDRVSILSSSGPIVVGALRSAAKKVFAYYNFSKSARIALCGLSPVDLITALIAFDGVVDAMLLLPASLDEALTKSLIEQAGCTCRIDNLYGEPFIVGVNEVQGNFKQHSTTWILATSGTTGIPKLIEHSHETLYRMIKRNMERGLNFVWGMVYDPCRFAGLQVLFQALLSGSRLCIPSSGNVNEQIDFFIKNQVNALSATPSYWRKLLMCDRICELPLRQITLGGEIADQFILNALKYYFPSTRIIHIYASTEAGSVFSVHDGYAGFPANWLDNSLAPAMLRISDYGHLLIKFEAHSGSKDNLYGLDTDGYLDTQDLVRVEGERVYFLGRVSGAINVGGNKVNPEEVENHIRNVCGVLDVRVFGRNSSMLGQIVVAEVMAASGFDVQELRLAIKQYCRSRMETWQNPAFISFVEEMTETVTGKRERLS